MAFPEGVSRNFNQIPRFSILEVLIFNSFNPPAKIGSVTTYQKYKNTVLTTAKEKPFKMLSVWQNFKFVTLCFLSFGSSEQ